MSLRVSCLHRLSECVEQWGKYADNKNRLESSLSSPKQITRDMCVRLCFALPPSARFFPLSGMISYLHEYRSKQTNSYLTLLLRNLIKKYVMCTRYFFGK